MDGRTSTGSASACKLRAGGRCCLAVASAGASASPSRKEAWSPGPRDAVDEGPVALGPRRPRVRWRHLYPAQVARLRRRAEPVEATTATHLPRSSALHPRRKPRRLRAACSRGGGIFAVARRVDPPLRNSRSALGSSQVKRVVVVSIRAYQVVLSPLLPACCRYQPTCSQYAVQAVVRHGVLGGLWRAAIRVGRCHRFGGCGYDPVE